MTTNQLHAAPDWAHTELGTHTRVVVAGDWHGNEVTARAVIAAAAAAGATAIIQCGDFGLWPGPAGKRFIHHVDNAADQAGVDIYWIDGNHEDFDRLERRRRGGEPRTSFGQRITHLARGTRWSWGGLQFCAVGGATSLDRASRTPHRSWWPQEELTGPQLADIIAAGTTDVLFTHDVSTIAPVPGIEHRRYTRPWSPLELERAWLHRERVTELTAALTPTHLFHGHFHVPYTATVTAPWGTVRATGLAADLDLRRNYQVLDIAELATASLMARSGAS